MKDGDITRQNMMGKLLAAIPEIKGRYNEESQWLDKDNTWVLCSFVLYRQIEALLMSDRPDEVQLRRIFDFLELLLSQQDLDVRNIVEDSVCENICSDEAVLQKAQRYMGALAKEYCARYMGHAPQ